MMTLLDTRVKRGIAFHVQAQLVLGLIVLYENFVLTPKIALWRNKH